MASPPARRYEPDELIFLANSPLVKKPHGLPSIEEWMGPLNPVRPAAARSRTDGDVLAANGSAAEDGVRSLAATGRRPSMHESRFSRSSIQEDMILGPPKPNFISASKPTRITGRESDALGFSGFDDTRGESPRFDRYRRDEKEKDVAPPRDFSDLRARRATPKEDGEVGWTPVNRTPQKTMGSEEGDRFRREFREGEKKGGNTPWDRDRKYEGFGKDREQRSRPRRDESSWLLEDRGQDRNNRDTYRENNNRYGGRAEKDPEWMDSSIDGKESKQAHSMEDFQKWKERMKANNGAPPRTGNAENEKKDPEPVAQVEQEPEVNQFGNREDDSSRDGSDDGVPLGKAPNGLASQNQENGVDTFFRFWGNNNVKTPDQNESMPSAAAQHKAPGKSRFESFFRPAEEPLQQAQQQQPTQPTQIRTSNFPISQTPPQQTESPANDEDREGFQRILNMLGKTKIGGPEQNSLPQLLSRPPPSAVSPPNNHISTQNVPSPQPQQQQQPPQHQQTQPQVPRDLRDPNADFFMRLMQQDQQIQQQQQQQQARLQAQQHPHQQNHPMHNQQPPLHRQHSDLPTKYGGPSGMPPPPQLDTGSLPPFHRGPNGPLSPPIGLDDPSISMFRPQRQHHDSGVTSPINLRGPAGPPPQLMDHHHGGPPPGWTPGPQNHSSQPPPSQSQRQVAPPPGFARAPPQQHQHQQGPPPPPPPPPFLAGPPGVNGHNIPFQLLNGPNGPIGGLPNLPPQDPRHPAHPAHQMFMANMNGINPGGPPPNLAGPPPQFSGMPPFPVPQHGPHPEMLAALHGGPGGMPFGFPGGLAGLHPDMKGVPPPFGHGGPPPQGGQLNKGLMR